MGRYGKSPKASKSIDLSLPSFSSGGTLQPSWPQAASKKLCNIARCREKWQSFVLVVPTKCSLGSRHIHCKHFSKALLSPFYILKWNGANDANSEAKKRIVHVYNIMYMSLYVHCVEYSPTKYGYGIVWSVWVIGPDQPIVGAEKKATLAMLNFFLGSRKHGIPKCGTWPWHSLQYWGKYGTHIPASNFIILYAKQTFGQIDKNSQLFKHWLILSIGLQQRLTEKHLYERRHLPFPRFC